MSARKSRGRRKKRSAVAWLMTLAALLALGLGLWLVLDKSVFVVRQVRVTGAGDIPESDVVRLSGIRLGRSLLRLDVGEVCHDVQADGRLAFVSLKKRYPSGVDLTVRPRTEDAVILQGGMALVLDDEGYVVRLSETIPDAQIPFVSGMRSTFYGLGRQLDILDGRVPAMTAILKAMKASGATYLAAEVNVDNPGDLRIISRTGATVLLGGVDNMEAKVAWMAAALEDLERRGERGGRLDVSSGSKADFKPEATAVPNPNQYGYGASEATAEPTVAPAS